MKIWDDFGDVISAEKLQPCRCGACRCRRSMAEVILVMRVLAPETALVTTPVTCSLLHQC